MADKKTLSKIGSTVSLPLALLLLIFFFLPWLDLTCAGNKVADASGWQLVTGNVTPEEMPGQEKDKDDPAESIKARPWFILCLIIPIAALLVGLQAVKGGVTAGGAGKALLVLGVIGLVMMIAAASVNYADDVEADMKAKQADQPKPPPSEAPPGMGAAMEDMGKQMSEQVGAAIKTEPTGVLWLSLVLYILLGACGVANLMLPKTALAAPAATPAPPTQQPPPPQEPPAQT